MTYQIIIKLLTIAKNPKYTTFFSKKLLTIFGKMIKYWLNLFGRFISMIKLIDEIITDYSKKLSARNQYYTNTIYSCFYSCSNKNNILKSVSVKTL